MAAEPTDKNQAAYSGNAMNYERKRCDIKQKSCVSSVQEEIDEEPDLTSLTWLTELRNQNITFANSFNMPPEVGNELHIQKEKGLLIKNIRYNFRNKQARPGKPNATNHQIQTPIKRASPAERYKMFLERIQRDLFEYKKLASTYQTDSKEKPPFNYSHIIGMAMLENGRVTLQQICTWIEEKFAFFRIRKKWNNSIRHNLSLHYCFRKIDRNKFEKGKGGYWELGVDPKKCERKRIRKRRTNRGKNDCPGQKLPNFGQNYDAFQAQILNTSESSEKIDVTFLSSLTNLRNFENNFTTDCSVGDETADSATESQHFHLGTIVINSEETDLSSVDLNLLGNSYDSIQHHDLITGVRESTQGFEDLTPSYILDTVDIQNQNILLGQLNIVEHVLQPNVNSYYAENIIGQSNSTILNGANENFKPYIDGIEEAFQYLRSIDQNNREDILDNILDISVSDY